MCMKRIKKHLTKRVNLLKEREIERARERERGREGEREKERERERGGGGEREKIERGSNIQGELGKELATTHSPAASADRRGFPHREWSWPQWSYAPLSPHCHSDPTTNTSRGIVTMSGITQSTRDFPPRDSFPFPRFI